MAPVYIFTFIYLTVLGLQLRQLGSFLAVFRVLSSCGMGAPEHKSSVAVVCWLRCSVACGILVPQPGTEPMFPALEGRFLTTGPPGKPDIIWSICPRSQSYRVTELNLIWLYYIIHLGLPRGYSVQFSRSFVSDSLQPHGLQHTRLLCPSPTPGVCSNS